MSKQLLQLVLFDYSTAVARYSWQPDSPKLLQSVSNAQALGVLLITSGLDCDLFIYFRIAADECSYRQGKLGQNQCYLSSYAIISH